MDSLNHRPKKTLTVVELTSLRRSGISDLFGLWAELTIGLEGVGRLRDPTVLVLVLRVDSRSSLSPVPSATPLGLRLGYAEPGTAGPPEGEQVFIDRLLKHDRSFRTSQGVMELMSFVLQKSECRLWRWYVEALRCALWPEVDDGAPEEEEDVECLLLPLVMALDRTRARLRLLPVRDSVPFVCVAYRHCELLNVTNF